MENNTHNQNNLGDEHRHKESMVAYPSINLSDDEFIIMQVKRSSVGLVAPVGGAILLVALIISLLINYDLIAEHFMVAEFINRGIVWIIGIALIFLTTIAAYAGVWIYEHNRFLITNESVIQEIQTSLLSRHEQTMPLSSVEDVSFKKTGIMQTLFDYGSIRLSTIGEENTYMFYYVANPKKQVATINNIVEKFKAGKYVG